MSLRGKDSESGNVKELFALRVEAGDTVLQSHLESAPSNAKYTSHRIQNELISICEDKLLSNIILDVTKSIGFSILAVETADISGIEQLSVGVRFVHMTHESTVLREEFIGFTPLPDMSATTIAEAILSKCRLSGLDLNKLLGQDYDGCSTMSGMYNGVQAKVRQMHPKAAFVHCSSHRLNLVVNDLNQVPQIRNTIGVIKSIIVFFRESPQRRSKIPNIPLFCETRWSSKYKSIRVFFENFDHVYRQLDALSMNGSTSTSRLAYQLFCSASTSTFQFCMVIMSKYSALLEPVTQALQQVQLDIRKVQIHVQTLIEIVKRHRNDTKYFRTDIYDKVVDLSEKLGIDIVFPRQCTRQQNRSNPGATDVEKCFRISIHHPYLDSLVTALESRFAESNNAQFNLFSLHPNKMANLDRQQFKNEVDIIHQTYQIENFVYEAINWYDFWSSNRASSRPISLDGEDITDLLPKTEFYPAVRHALLILLTLPVTTCTIERSFSTLRRVKTWLRSTMADDRLSSLCMMSVCVCMWFLWRF